ncbi:MAG: hypothetical protein JXR96_14965 [Deltaproteobacteria bacterium]|nr:hypothetical protein [Deltaproteobacteria bacterium]
MAEQEAQPREGKQRRGPGFFGWLRRLVTLIVLVALGTAGYWIYDRYREAEALKEIVSRLTAEERVAEVLVEEYHRGPAGKADKVKLKVLEYDTQGKPLPPVYCTFSVNDVIHFEALVIRLNDELVMDGKGKSIFLFRRAFALDDSGQTYESCSLSEPMEVPGGYAMRSDDPKVTEVERRLWKSFWQLALDEKSREKAGVKNAQIEAPATRFVPDTIYRLVLQHAGGLYIQARPVPEILKNKEIQTPEGAGEVR